MASEPETLFIPDDMLTWSVIGAFVRGATLDNPRSTIVSISARQLFHLVAAADTHGGGVSWELERLAEFGVVDLVVRLDPPKGSDHSVRQTEESKSDKGAGDQTASE